MFTVSRLVLTAVIIRWKWLHFALQQEVKFVSVCVFSLCVCVAWWKLPRFLLVYSEARHQECQGVGLWGVSAQRRRSQQGLFTHQHTITVSGHIFLHKCSCTADNNWHFFDFEPFCRTKKKALLDVCLNEYETFNCQPNLIPLFPTGGLGGPILFLPTSPAGGQSDRIHFSPLLLALSGKQQLSA